MIEPLTIDGLCNQMGHRAFRQLSTTLGSKLSGLLKHLNLEPTLLEPLQAAYVPICHWLHNQVSRSPKPLLIGICGAQGSGKTTLRCFAELILCHGYGLRVAGFSLDDLYYTRLERQKMGASVHPLFSTRGVPGTHDLLLGRTLLSTLGKAAPQSTTALPRFNKAIDDRSPRSIWPIFVGKPDVILLDGWCLGSEPESKSALQRPINDLERLEDKEGIWRRFVNHKLETEYAPFFRLIDRLIFLQVPAFRWVERWRWQQEKALRHSALPGERSQVMTRDQIRRFIMIFERLTRQMLAALPDKADLICRLNTNHLIDSIRHP